MGSDRDTRESLLSAAGMSETCSEVTRSEAVTSEADGSTSAGSTLSEQFSDGSAGSAWTAIVESARPSTRLTSVAETAKVRVVTGAAPASGDDSSSLGA